MEIIDFSEDDEEDDSGIFSSTGAQRIIEALHTTPWPNMERRKSDDCNTKSNGAPDPKTATNHQNDQQKKKIVETSPNASENLGRESDDDNFEELFAKFASFKDKASGLNDAERKAYAEKVATSFWMALGGDENEIGGLDDSDLE